MAKGDARSSVPASRYKIGSHHSSSGKPGASVTEYGYFLDETVDLGALDTSFFPLARKELENLDPQQRILLEVARESLDDAGEVGWRGKDIGVYVGNFGNDWYDLYSTDRQRSGPYSISTTHDFALSNRVSYEMDLRGPSMTIRTACSSSLIALSEACTSMARGECSSAIVGGTNLHLAPFLTAAISDQGALSPDGSCKTFSSAANGYARGEGIVAFFLKPLRDAIRDGNPVRAVVVGAAANADGKTPGFSMPNADAHEELIRTTYKLAGIDEADICRTGYFECHGTGTAVGDVIETVAIAKVFADSGGIHIGSVKPNMGHGEGASGLTALLKAVLALENRVIPPTIKCLPLNPKIPFESSHLTVVSEPTPWPEGRYERVSVNSFGIGGSNAHVIIDSAARFNITPTLESDEQDENKPHLLLFSANTSHSLHQMAKQWSEYLEQNAENTPLSRVAYSLAMRREHLPFRSFSVVTKHMINIKPSSTAGKSTAKAPNLVMVFTGQGSQWPQMGRELLQTNTIFLRSIRLLDEYLQDLGVDAPEWRIEDELVKPSYRSRVDDAEYSQPLCTALQIALVDILTSIGIRPQVVVGHSSGEIAAAYAAGGLKAKDAITVAFYRGLISKKQTKPGAMAAVNMGWQDAQTHLRPGVVIACENSPNSVTLSGDADKVKMTVQTIKKEVPNVLASILKVNKAYHSHHMLALGEEYHQMMTNAGVVAETPSLPFFSSVTGDLLRSGTCEVNKLGPKYWRKNLESPVLFKDAVYRILQNEALGATNLVFLEVGPHSALSGPVRQILGSKSAKAPLIPTLIRRQNSLASLLASVGRLWELQFNIDFSHLVGDGPALPDLPRYPWNHQRSYWNESRISKEIRLQEYPYDDLLGTKVPESPAIEPLWRNLLQVDRVSWLRDHKIGDDIIFPFAGYIAVAAEAIRQISNIHEAFEIRNINVATGLVLVEGSPTELLTSFHRCRLTEVLDSDWWDFSISAYNGYVWTKHCYGTIRATSQISSGKGDIPCSTPLPNNVNMPRWYERVRRAGLNYGPHFMTVEEMQTTTSGSRGKANGKLRRSCIGDEANCHIHPVVLDTFFQLVAAAFNHGNTNGYVQYIPLNVEYMAVSRCLADSIEIETTCEQFRDGTMGAGVITANSEVFGRVSGAHLGPLDKSATTSDDDTLPVLARSEWVPHIDFIGFSSLVTSTRNHLPYWPMLESFTDLMIIQSQRALVNIATPGFTFPLQKYKEWISGFSVPSLSELNTSELKERADSLCASLTQTPAASVAIAITKVFMNMKHIVSGQKSPLDSIGSDQVVSDVFSILGDFELSDFFHCLSHSKPNLRVLELGTGRGSPQNGCWKFMQRPDGQVLYSKYVYTERIPALTTAAKEAFGKLPLNFELRTLDISQRPQDQGLEETFDLIIANNTLHSTASLGTSLRHVRSLFAPGGRLLLHQPQPGLLWTKYIFGSFPGWWIGVDDGRPDCPYADTRRWADELLSAGFKELQDVVPDSPEPYHMSTVMMAEVAWENPETSKRITLLYDDHGLDAAKPFIRRLQEAGFLITCCKMGEVLPEGQDVISLLEQSKPFLSNLDAGALDTLKSLVSQLSSSGAGIFWVRTSPRVPLPDPRFALVSGLSRVIRSEIGIDFATCEVDDLTSPIGINSMLKAFRAFHQRHTEGLLDPDFEYSCRGGKVHVPRFFPFAPEKNSVVPKVPDQAILKLMETGRLDSLRWVDHQPRAPAIDEVEVEVHAAGMNFRDVLTAMGSIGFRSRDPALGHEAAGVVRRVGSEVTRFRPGDRVVVMAARAFSTLVTQKEALCEELPADMSFVDGASMPVIYVTALHSLINIARLEKGQSILIHSGCGGVGLASIQVAHLLGANIYATVSNDEKADYLVNTFNIPRHRIFNSRNTSFVDDLMRETKGRGADVVLNSLSGELLHATWRCVSEFGVMVEIGKTDLYGKGRLDMDVFLANRAYSCVNILSMGRERPAIIKRLLQTMMTFYRQGLIKPVRLAEVVPATAIKDAFRLMQQGTHIGKIAISICEDTSRKVELDHIYPSPQDLALFDSNASYLLVGGLGGLGRSVTVWMAQMGARDITILSRRATDGQSEVEFVHMLASLGCTLRLCRGDVTNLDDVSNSMKASPRPLKGIIQMSMVLRDRGFLQMTFEDWFDATEPKVRGTWNLHEASGMLNANLDFFVLMSSLSGIIGQTGQANYAAANTFLDAFAGYRNALGLPCVSIDLGAMEGVGYLSENGELLKKMQGTGWRSVTEEAFLKTLRIAIETPFSAKSKHCQHINGSLSSHGPENLVGDCCIMLGLSPIIPLSSPDSSSRLRRDARMAVYHNTAQGSGGSGHSEANGPNTLRAFLSQAKTDVKILKGPAAANFLASEIGKKLFALILKPEEEPNIKLGLSEVGLDSMVAAEMRAWWKMEFGLSISVLEMLGTGTLSALGEKAAKGLAEMYEG